MYVQDNFKEIGYQENAELSKFKNSRKAGELCKSGIAYIKNSSAAVCIEISHVTTNLDNFVSKQKKGPFKCSLNKTYNQPAGCRYHFVDEKGVTGVISEEYCECSMNSTLNE